MKWKLLILCGKMYQESANNGGVLFVTEGVA